METSIQLSLSAFEKFKEKDMKETLRNLNQIKNLKKNNEQTVLRIQHNILVCEFASAETAAARHKVTDQLEKLILEMKHDAKGKSEDEGRNGKIKNKQSPQKEPEEEHDVSLLVLNLATMHYLARCPRQAYQVLTQHFVASPIKSNNHFVKAKAYVLLLDICLQSNDVLNAMKILKILGQLRSSIESEQLSYLDGYLKKEQQNEEKDKHDTYNHILQKDSKPYSPPPYAYQYCSLVCGFVLNQHGETKLLVNLKEYSLMTDLFKAMVLIQLEKYQLATLQLKQVKSGLKEKESQEHLLAGKLPGDAQPSSLFQFVQKQLVGIYKYAKANNAYRQNLFRKTILHLSPSQEIKVNVHGMPAHNQIYAILQLNNLGCVHLKMKKPVLAIYYLSRALELASTRPSFQSAFSPLVMQSIQLKVEHVKYNLVQALLMNRKTLLAQKSLEGVLHHFKDKYRLWFCIGTQLLQQYHEMLDRHQQKQKYDLFEDILDDYEPRYKHDADNKLMRRYVLGRPSEQTSPLDDNNTDNSTSSPDDLLRKSVSSLRNCLYLISKSVPTEDVQAKNKMVESLFNCSILAQEQEKTEQRIAQQKAMKTACLIKLAYGLLCLNQPNHAYKACQEALQQTLSEYQRNLINTYLLEIYLLQGRLDQATQQASSLSSSSISEQQLVCRNVLFCRSQQFCGVQYQVVLLTNMAALELMHGRLGGAQKYIKQALSALEIKNNQFLQLPLALLNLTIYVQLLSGNNHGALNILKRKRIMAQPTAQGQAKPMLKITK